MAIAVIVENGGWGAAAAAPIARELFDYYLTGRRSGVSSPDSPLVKPPRGATPSQADSSQAAAGSAEEPVE